MENDEDFIRIWEDKLKNGKLKYIIKTFMLFFTIFFLIDLVLGKFVFGDATLIDFFIHKNWDRVLQIIPLMLIGSLACSWVQYWSLNKTYKKLKSGN